MYCQLRCQWLRPAAGELATEYGITGWPEGAAIAAAAEAFKLWRGQRGGGNDERRQVAERMSDFLERHGDGRFSNVDSEVEAHLRDRAGWWRQSGDSREYRLTAEAMREAIKGFDFQRGLALLKSWARCRHRTPAASDHGSSA